MTTITLDPQETSTDIRSHEYDQWKSAGYYVPKFQTVVSRELDRLAALKPNWEAEGAGPICPQLIQAARNFAKDLPENIVAPPAVVPMAAGNLQFEWNDGSRSLELEVKDTRTVHYLKWDSDEGIEEEDFFCLDEVDRAVTLIRWFTRSVANV